MSEAYYSVVRCVPDPARGELFNVGVVVWTENTFRVAVDSVAARRAARENPLLARDAFRSLQDVLQTRIGRLTPFSQEGMRELIMNQPGLPVALAEPSYIRLTGATLDAADALDGALQRLMDRLVSPQEVVEESISRAAEAPLDQRLAPLIGTGRVRKDYEVHGGRSGLPRHIDYFVDSAANVGLDTLRLDRGGEETLLGKADAEAFKIVDVLNSRKLSVYYVYCSLKDDPKWNQFNNDLRGVLASAGGTVLTRMEDAAASIEKAALH